MSSTRGRGLHYGSPPRRAPSPDRWRYLCGECQRLCGPRDVDKNGLRQHRSTSSRHQPLPGAAEREDDAIDDFFKDYPDFPYDRTAPFWQEFRYLNSFSGWPTTKKERKEDDDTKSPQKLAWQAFRIAVVKSFNATFGSQVDDIEAWGKLCKAAGVRDIPEDIKDRKKLVESPHINLVDLHECGRMGTKAKVWDTEDELVAFTQKSGKKFPLEFAYAEPLLRFLLREIDNPYLGNRRNTEGDGGSVGDRRRGESRSGNNDGELEVEELRRSVAVMQLPP
ncbi:hypothetical protein K440DRAFT_606534 [Wilcoxina mikolae CBS 423.85]|nr:hypothetical protein K440DRAFT_606534 [Wilcoxina mikolae CBS 423.85]